MQETPASLADHCPECGAPLAGGLTCWEQLCAILAWEWQDPALAAQHFLTVASYNLQHPAQFTDEAITGLREMFIDVLDNGVPVVELRARAGRAAQGKRRVRRTKAERKPVLRRWRATITDVHRAGEPEGAAERVKAWATTICAELRAKNA